MKLIFVTSCKPIDNEKTKIRQMNSILSWDWLDCDKEIFLFNKDEQIVSLYEHLNITIVKEYESSNNSDLPTWRAMKDYASNVANEEDYIVWVNSDIIFDNTLLETIEGVEKSTNNFILTGKRKNWDDYHLLSRKDEVRQIPFTDQGDKWEIDYYVFKKNHFKDLPKFYIARMSFDNYLLQNSIRNVEHTVDCTLTINAIHHTHGYGKNSEQTWSDFHKENPEVMNEVGENREVCRQIANIESCRYITKKNNQNIELVRK